MIYELKVSLEDMPLPITRTFHFPSDATFYDLHQTIMASFNWEDLNPHLFEVMKTDGEIAQDEVILSFMDLFESEADNSDEEFFEVTKDPDSVYDDDVLLEDYFKQVSDTVLYKYDRPNFWNHLITLQQIVYSDEELELPVCVNAENDAPEEHSQEEIHTFEDTLRNDDSIGLVKEINSLIEMAFEEITWDEEFKVEIESLVDNLVSQVFDEMENGETDPDEETK